MVEILLLMDADGAYVIVDASRVPALKSRWVMWSAHPHALFLEQQDGRFECIHGDEDSDAFLARAVMEGWITMTSLGWDATPLCDERHPRGLPERWFV